MTRHIRLAATGAVIAALALSACSTDKGDSAATGAAEAKPLRITAGGGPTFPRNFNLFAPASVDRAPGKTFIYEPLLAADRTKVGAYKPWLAQKYEWSQDGKTLTFTLRDGVKWSDGKPLTSADVAFTLGLNPGKTWSSVETPDAKTVVVKYDAPAFADIVNWTKDTRVIAPEHIWKSQDAKTWTNPDPVGTGPFTISAFSPQQITLKMRPDYWGGKGKGVNEVKILTQGDAASVRARMSNHELDWATVGWPGVTKEFVAKDPEHNVFKFYNAGGSDGIIFNTTKAPLNDAAVRRALRDSLDVGAAAKVVDVGYAAPNVQGLEPSVYADLLKPEYAKAQVPQVDRAKSDLTSAGWTVKDGALTKDGKSYPLSYSVYQPYAEWVSTGQLLADQWQTALGLKVAVKQMGDQPFTAALTKGEFQMASDTPALPGTFYTAFEPFGKSGLVPLGQDASGNYGRWDNPKFQGLLAQLKGIDVTDAAAQKDIAGQMQDIINEEAPFIGTATAGWKAEFNTTNWTGWPTPAKEGYAPNGTLAADAIQTLLNITPAK